MKKLNLPYYLKIKSYNHTYVYHHSLRSFREWAEISPQKLDRNQDTTDHLCMTHGHTSASLTLKPCPAEVNLFV